MLATRRETEGMSKITVEYSEIEERKRIVQMKPFHSFYHGRSLAKEKKRTIMVILEEEGTPF